MDNALNAIGEKDLGVIVIEGCNGSPSVFSKYLPGAMTKMFGDLIAQCIVVDRLAAREETHPDAKAIHDESLQHITGYPHVIVIGKGNVYAHLNKPTAVEVMEEIQRLARELNIPQLPKSNA